MTLFGRVVDYIMCVISSVKEASPDSTVGLRAVSVQYNTL